RSAFDLWVTADDRLRVEPGAPRRRPTKYWQKVRKHAQLLLGDGAIAGRDYALTEVVHCRSADEEGVQAALEPCVERYLSKVLALSPATLIVVFGTVARDVMRERYKPDTARLTAPVEVEGRMRRLAFLAHPCAIDPGHRLQWLPD